jgi:hypothetical protein
MWIQKKFYGIIWCYIVEEKQIKTLVEDCDGHYYLWSGHGNSAASIILIHYITDELLCSLTETEKFLELTRLPSMMAIE